jgi:preprotein translocase subunit SecF
VVASVVFSVISVASLFYPGPKLGIDFAGGTELQIQFTGDVSAGELRGALERIGHAGADVVSVEGHPNEYMIRVESISALPEAEAQGLEAAIRAEVGNALTEFRPSPGGDKISLRFQGPQDPQQIRQWLEGAGAKVRGVNAFGSPEDNRYEAHLIGVGDEIVAGLRQSLGDRVPDAPLRVEWVGPKAGQQLRDAAIQSLLYTIAFIMVYVAFRFDLRFAPGGVVALVHDVTATLGIYVLMQREVSLSTVAALLTIVGYSINDTIVVYDRIRENMSRTRNLTLYQIINRSTSETLSRTIMTSLTTVISIIPFFIWGTPVIQDLTFALVIGIGIGTYSSIFIAAPFTEWMDRRFFRRAAPKPA